MADDEKIIDLNDDDAHDDDAHDDLPKGLKNYITPEGLARLETEFDFLKRDERPKIVEVVSWVKSAGSPPWLGRC